MLFHPLGYFDLETHLVNANSRNGWKGDLGSRIAAAVGLLVLLITLRPVYEQSEAPSRANSLEAAAELPGRPAVTASAGHATRFASREEPSPTAAAEVWVAYGAEFWRRGVREARQSRAVEGSVPSRLTATTSHAALFNVAEVMERVSSAIGQNNASSEPEFETWTYTALFRAEGLRFTAHPPTAVAVAAVRYAPDVGALSARIRTASVRLGERELLAADYDPPGWRIVGNTAQRPLANTPGLTEHCETRRDGVELSWILGQRPTRPGELEIVVEVTGADFANVSARGHHFADSEGRERIRFGSSVAVDTAGRTEDLTTRWDGQFLRIRVPESFLVEAVFPVAVDPVIGAEFGMDQPVPVPSPWDQREPAIGSNGTNFLVVWSDGPQFFRRIIGTRVTSSGQVLDPAGLRISAAGGDDTAPAVSGNGRDYFVVWRHEMDQFGFGLGSIRGSRVSALGEVLDPEGLPLSFAPPAGGPVIASAGGSCLVAWEQSFHFGLGSVNQIVARAIPFSGGLPVLTNQVQRLAPNMLWQHQPAAASNSREYVVVWAESPVGVASDDIRSVRVGVGGELLTMEPALISVEASFRSWPAIASDGTNYLVAWAATPPDGPLSQREDLFGARLTADGLVLDAEGIPLARATEAQLQPGLSFDGIGYHLSWLDGRAGAGRFDIYSRRLSLAGLPSSPERRLAPTQAGEYSQSGQRVASAGEMSLLAWESSSEPVGIAAALLSSAGEVVLTHERVATRRLPNSQERARAASNGRLLLMVWEDTRPSFHAANTEYDILGTRLALDGTILDPDGIRISQSASDQLRPAVAGDGRDFLVVWEDFRNQALSLRDIYGTVVTESGTVLSPTGTALSGFGDQRDPVVAGTTNGYLVVWEEDRYSDPDIYAIRVARDGSRQGSEIEIARLPADQRNPDVATSGQEYLVVWHDRRNDPVSARDIYGARVMLDGRVMDRNGIPISIAPHDQRDPSVASNGPEYLVVWEDERGRAGFDVFGARLTRNGIVLDPHGIAIAIAPRDQRNPAIAANGADYFVVWQDEDRGHVRDPTDIYGTAILGDGTVLQTQSVGIEAGPHFEERPTIVTAGMGYLVGYFGPSAAHEGANRVTARFLTIGLAAHLRPPVREPDGTLRFKLEGAPGFFYTIEFSSNLVNWYYLGQVKVPDQGMEAEVIDTQATAASRRFYRATTRPLVDDDGD